MQSACSYFRCKPLSSNLTDLQIKPCHTMWLRVQQPICLKRKLVTANKDSRPTVFCDVTPCGMVIVYRRFRGTSASTLWVEEKVIRATSEKQAASIPSPYTLNMEEIFSSETSGFYRTIRHKILEDSTLNMW
jgi:hypothetical protein